MFSILLTINFNFEATFSLPYAIAFNLEKSKMLSFGKEFAKDATVSWSPQKKSKSQQKELLVKSNLFTLQGPYSPT